MTSIFDDIAPAFRAAIARWPDAPNLKTHFADLASTFENNGSSLVELSKSFVEMVCITIITELGKELPASSRPTTTELLGCALDALGIRNQRGSSALGTILSGYNKVSDGLADVRNHEGSVGHGKDGFIDAISDRHARVYLLSADTIIALLLQAYDGVEPSILKTRESHSRFSHHNERIDSATQIEAAVDEEGVVELSFLAGTLEDGFDIRVSASELLYYLDRQAYVDVLDALRGVTTEAQQEEIQEPEEVKAEPVEETQPEEVADQEMAPVSKKLQPVTKYEGKYKDQASPLYDYFLYSILGGDTTFAAQVQNLAYTVLNGMEEMAVVDWSSRPSTRAEVRLFLKKLVKLFSIEDMEEKNVDEIVTWLGQRIPGGEQ